MGLRSKIIDVCEEINKEMPKHIIDLISKTLNKCKLSINGSKIIVFGISYKPNIDDVRESPALKIIEELLSMGAEVTYYDPYVEKFKLNNGELFYCTSEEKYKNGEFDCSIIMTHHDCMNYDLVRTKTIVDTKNVVKNNGFCEILTIL
jgi:UDP-N-acetyl-D-glucosamine dehydrogenase